MDVIAPAIQKPSIDLIGLIDADYMKYHVLSRLSSDWSTKEVKDLAKEAVAQLEAKFNAKALLYCFSGHYILNYRSKIGFEKSYKGNRKVKDEMESIQVKAIVIDYIKNRYPTLLLPELEADDIVSMLQCEDTFIYSEDKDLKQVPGVHWNVKKNHFYEITPSEALSFLMEQMIIGDTVDNIGGLKGCGPVACSNLLTNSSTEDIPLNVIKAYIQAHGSTIKGLDSFSENWMLLKTRINRGEHFRKEYARAFNTLELLKS